MKNYCRKREKYNKIIFFKKSIKKGKSKNKKLKHL